MAEKELKAVEVVQVAEPYVVPVINVRNPTQSANNCTRPFGRSLAIPFSLFSVPPFCGINFLCQHALR